MTRITKRKQVIKIIISALCPIRPAEMRSIWSLKKRRAFGKNLLGKPPFYSDKEGAQESSSNPKKRSIFFEFMEREKTPISVYCPRGVPDHCIVLR